MSSDLYSATLAADAVIAKVLHVDELTRIARLETVLRRFLVRRWATRANEAARVAAHVSPASVYMVVDDVMRRWSGDVADAVRSAIRSIYALAKQWTLQRAKRRRVLKAEAPTELDFGVGIDLSLEDHAAIKAIEEHQLFWIGRHYEDHVSASIADVVKDVILEAGGDRVEAGRLMRSRIRETLDHVQIPSGWSGSSKSYFEGLVANAATVARTQGQIKTMASVRITRYEITNPLDERTCPVCSHMDGKIFEVEAADHLVSKVNAVAEPRDVRRIHPWIRAVELKTLSPKAGAAGKTDERRLSSMGFIMPPFHMLCRCFVDISEEG